MIDQEALDAATIDELDELQQMVQATIARKVAVANIPQQVTQLADDYRRGGGDPATLAALITGTAQQPEPEGEEPPAPEGEEPAA